MDHPDDLHDKTAQVPGGWSKTTTNRHIPGPVPQGPDKAERLNSENDCLPDGIAGDAPSPDRCSYACSDWLLTAAVASELLPETLVPLTAARPATAAGMLSIPYRRQTASALQTPSSWKPFAHHAPQ
jgi:hypothetical protein